ncbi:hypothetical protein THZB04_100173 [Vibrio owensii]|nr:hypothetical protein THZB04_100173 [Vibrio owensii]
MTKKHDAVVAELVDAPDLGSGAARCESSSLSDRTMIEKPSINLLGFFFFPILDSVDL